jgi:glycolate oxidase iron-sulfur subunit
MSELQTSPETAKPMRDVVDYDLLFDCVHCGLCLEACPTYVLTRKEMDSPRGRIYLMKALAEGRMELEPDVVRHLDLCLGCRGCETACPSGVHYGRLIEKARAYVEYNYSRGLVDRLRRRAVSALFPYPERVRSLLWPVKLLERFGLRPLAERALPGKLGAWLALLPPLTVRQNNHASTSWLTAKPHANGPTVVVHHGCVAQVFTDAENHNTERLLKAAGYRVTQLARTECCGALDLHLGNVERARRFARANVRELARTGAKAVVSAGSGCSATIAEYGHLLSDDLQLKEDAQSVASKVQDLSTLLLDSKLSFPKFPCTVTYHDACHLRHALGVREAPRKLLSSIPGLRLVEMQEADLCCGSAGSYNLTEPEMAADLARRKTDNIIATGADYVVLSNPGCELQIAAGLRRRKAKTKVLHLADFLALAMGHQI